ncbi:MAG: hypothetical protein AB1792_03880 [Candidatus Zixiibacteriota bacterium]
MNRRLPLSGTEIISEGLREIVSTVLALLLVVPAVLIRTADRLVSTFIRRRGGLD